MSRESTFLPPIPSTLFVSSDTGILEGADQSRYSGLQSSSSAHKGSLVINADDWGRNQETTDKIFDCVKRGTVSSVSAMVFMQDSERAAVTAREQGIDAGLHLNFTTAFSGSDCPSRLKENQQGVAAYLLRRRVNQVVFHPWLARSFAYIVAAQLDEFRRLYGAAPQRLDGHHHMHLSTNVLFSGLLPEGAIVRRNFSFQPGEKGLVNRLFRRAVDFHLARRHRLVDFLFSLVPFEARERMERIRRLAGQFDVEVETHPINADEYRFLTEGEIYRWTRGLPIAKRFTPSCLGGGQK